MSALKADTDFDAKVWVERILHGAQTAFHEAYALLAP